jgi:hypothetical protein
LLSAVLNNPLHVLTQVQQDDPVKAKLTSTAEVVQLYRYPGMSESAANTLLHKVSALPTLCYVALFRLCSSFPVFASLLSFM